MLLITVKEVGVSGQGYHLANGKVIEVTDEEAERLEALYPGCFEEYAYLKPEELLDKLASNHPQSTAGKPDGDGGEDEEDKE